MKKRPDQKLSEKIVLDAIKKAKKIKKGYQKLYKAIYENKKIN